MKRFELGNTVDNDYVYSFVKAVKGGHVEFVVFHAGFESREQLIKRALKAYEGSDKK